MRKTNMTIRLALLSFIMITLASGTAGCTLFRTSPPPRHNPPRFDTGASYHSGASLLGIAPDVWEPTYHSPPDHHPGFRPSHSKDNHNHKRFVDRKENSEVKREDKKPDNKKQETRDDNKRENSPKASIGARHETGKPHDVNRSLGETRREGRKSDVKRENERPRDAGRNIGETRREERKNDVKREYERPRDAGRNVGETRREEKKSNNKKQENKVSDDKQKKGRK